MYAVVNQEQTISGSQMKTEIVLPSELGRFRGCNVAYGHFSTVHAGHIRYLRHARVSGKQLLVAIMPDEEDGKTFPFSQQERAEGLKLLGLADAIVKLEPGISLVDILERAEAKRLVLGDELKNAKSLAGAVKYLKINGGEVVYHAGERSLTTVDLMESSEKVLERRRVDEFLRACEKQQIDLRGLTNELEKLKLSRLLVVGDCILDRYAACEPVGMSAEAPVIVVKEVKARDYSGGAAIVASHIAGLGSSCELLSVVGNDECGDILSSDLDNMGVSCNLIVDETRPTTFKKRYIVDGQKLFRVSKMEQHNIGELVEEELVKRIRSHAAHVNGIVVSDFVYGVVTPGVLECIGDVARQRGLKLYGDLQCSSQVGNANKFKGYTVLTPNERELRLATRDKDAGIESLARRFMEASYCENLMVKLASEGLVVYKMSRYGQISSQAFPALSVTPVDVTGAGDSILAVVSAALSAGIGIMKAAALACCIAAVAVENMGNVRITKDDLRKKVEEMARFQ